MTDDFMTQAANNKYWRCDGTCSTIEIGPHVHYGKNVIIPVTFHVIDPKCGQPFVEFVGKTIPHVGDDIGAALDAELLLHLDGTLVRHGDPFVCDSCGRDLDEDLDLGAPRSDPSIFPMHPENFKPA